MVLDLLGELYDKGTRFETASRIAGHLGCTHLMIFTQDAEIQQVLPAPGFPQTLPDGKAWHNFLAECVTKGAHSGTLAFPDKQHYNSASGFSGLDGTVVVCLGGSPGEDELSPLKAILPLLTKLFRLEQGAINSEIRVALAQNSAEKAEKLARALELMRRQLKEALGRKEKDKKAIEDLMSKKDEFMNVASHELKTPITNMKGYLQILKKEFVKKNGSSINLLEKADHQINKLTGLVNDLLDVTKIQAGKMLYNFCEFEISQVISEVVSQAQVAVTTHQIMITGTVQSRVQGDKNRIEQVISNLLSNAVKYSPNAEKIIISTSLTGNAIQISVKDFGIGIPAENQKHIFDRFYRVEECSQQFSGLGLGLYISAEIIRRHGGTIGVMSDASGTEFYFSLPLATQNPLRDTLIDPLRPGSPYNNAP